MTTIDCGQILSFLPEYLRDQLGAEVDSLLAEHLRHCVPCSIAYESAQDALEQMEANWSDEEPHHGDADSDSPFCDQARFALSDDGNG